MKQHVRFKNIIFIGFFIVILFSFYKTTRPYLVFGNENEYYNPLQVMVNERTFTPTLVKWEFVKLSFVTTVKKQDGTVVTNDPNVNTVLIMDNGTISEDSSNFNYAMFAAYDQNGLRIDKDYYFLCSKNKNISFKVKTYVNQNIAKEYRSAEIDVKVLLTGSQTNDVLAIRDNTGVDLSQHYLNIPLPVNGTDNEYPNSGQDNNTSYKDDAKILFDDVRSR